jgi:hypothetical protein
MFLSFGYCFRSEKSLSTRSRIRTIAGCSVVHRDRLAATFSTTLALTGGLYSPSPPYPTVAFLPLHCTHRLPSKRRPSCVARWLGEGPLASWARPGAGTGAVGRSHAVPPSSATGWPKLAVPRSALRHTKEG